jgi:hypothetical protein
MAGKALEESIEKKLREQLEVDPTFTFLKASHVLLDIVFVSILALIVHLKNLFI